MLIGAVIGFTNLGEVNSHLQEYVKTLQDSGEGTSSLASSMLVFMVQGLFSRLEFPYAQFPCTALCGDQLYQPFWEAVSRLERIGLKVLGLSCNGLSTNRRFFKLHTVNSDLVHKVPNPYAHDGRSLYFISDPPHLMKSVWNAWANKKRRMWVRKKRIIAMTDLQFYCTLS